MLSEITRKDFLTVTNNYFSEIPSTYNQWYKPGVNRITLNLEKTVVRVQR